MTISSLASQITVAGSSSQTAFSFPFVGAAAADITVSSVASNGQITLVSPTNYTVTLNSPAANQIWGVGGVVVYPLSGPPLPVGNSLIISRVLPYSQQITTQNQGNYYAQVTEQALDTLEMQIQQLATRTTQFRGIWLTGTVYNAGDIVQDGANGNNTSNYYICAIPNTSGTWTTDLAAGDWTLSAVAAVPTGQLTLTGDITGSGTTPIATTLATVNLSIGTFNNATVTVNGKGLVTQVSSGSTGSGTVSNVTFTGDGTVLSSTPSSAVTTTGTLTAALLAKAKNTVLAGPVTGSNANPTFRALASQDIAGLPGVYTKGNTITLNPFAQATLASGAHGLGSQPNGMIAYLQCLTGELGYNAGDRILISSGYQNTGAETAFWADGTNAGFGTINSNPVVVNKNGASASTITAANWQIIMIPLLYN